MNTIHYGREFVLLARLVTCAKMDSGEFILIASFARQPRDLNNIGHQLWTIQLWVDFRGKAKQFAPSLRPDGGVVTQRIANPRTPVRFRVGPPEPLRRRP